MIAMYSRLLNQFVCNSLFLRITIDELTFKLIA